MMKWIVVYFFVQMIYVACPPSTPIADEFGRVYESDGVEAVACWDTKTTRLEKRFATKNEALDFVERAKKESDLQGFELHPVVH